jgi:hypothetical protein
VVFADETSHARSLNAKITHTQKNIKFNNVNINLCCVCVCVCVLGRSPLINLTLSHTIVKSVIDQPKHSTPKRIKRKLSTIVHELNEQDDDDESGIHTRTNTHTCTHTTHYTYSIHTYIFVVCISSS